MIIVRVELHSAVNGQVTELARMHVCNEGGTNALRDYSVQVLRGRSKEDLDRRVVQRRGALKQFPSLRLHVWNLVLCALVSAGYKGMS